MYTQGSGIARLIASVLALVIVASGCGTGSEVEVGSSDPERPTIVVTTNILGDVVTEMVGDQANVVTIMPVGADPHDFQPSAQQVDQLLEADALIVNGGAFEEGLLDVIESAQEAGVPTFEALDSVSTINFGSDSEDHGDEDHGDEDHGDEDHEDEDEDHGDEDHEDEDHGDEDHGDEDHEDEDHDDHGHDGVDPHFFTDPARMVDVVGGIELFLADNVTGLDTEVVAASVSTYREELEVLDVEVDDLVADVPTEKRVLVTNHDVFGYFADRYDFEVVGAVIPNGTTVGSASASDLADLAKTIEAEGVPAIFAETSSSSELIDTLAAEAGADVEVVELYAESLGQQGSDGATYIEMVRTNATRISEALG